MIKIIKSASLTLFLFGLLGWLYVVLSVTFHPHTLSWQLTHFASWPREDTFGEISFVVSFLSFFVWNLVKDSK